MSERDVFVEPVAGEAGWLRRNARVVGLGWILCAGLAAVFGVMFSHPWLGVGPDPDDAMRFVQIRDLLEGQSWFDLSQKRLGPEGTALHWSRLSDLPFVVVALALEPLLGVDGAVRAAGSVVPGLVAGLFALGVLRGVSALAFDGVHGDARLPVVAAVAVALQILAFPGRFAFGAFDHHHLQIALLALAIGFSAVRAPRAGDGVLVGLSVAGSLTIGLESAPVLAMVCAFWAARWWLTGGDRDAVGAFGASLAVGALAGWAVFTHGGVWSGVVCDAFGLPLAALLVLGGVGLWAGARWVESAVARTAVLAALAVAAVAVVGLGAPQCAGNPMNALPVAVREGWLSQVSEARPLLSPAWSAADMARLVGVPVAACGVGLLMAWRRRDPAWLCLAAVCATVVAMTFYQTRFHTFAAVAAAVVMARVLVDVLGWERHPDGREVSPLKRMPVMLVVLALSSPVVMAAGAGALWKSETAAPELAGSLAGGMSAGSMSAGGMSAGTESADAPVCGGQAVLDALGGLPMGQVFASLDLAPDIIRATSHVPLAGNYHRGSEDIADWLRLAATPADSAVASLRAAGVDYLLVCEGGNAESVYGAMYPEGLLRDPAGLGAVAGLEEVARPNAWVRILRVQAE